jgi:hypothetical protein
MRYELQDIDGTVYSPYVLMDQYNKGNKLLRKTILDNMPMQLAEEVTDNVDAGESITMVKKPIKLIDVRVNKKPINKFAMTAIQDKTITGEPRAYYMIGTNTLKLYPIPDKTYSYEITYIPESVTMQDIDDSGYQTDVEQLLVRYVVAMLTNGSFDLVAEYNATIGKLLGGIETGVTVINGYYSDCDGGRDYN